MARRTGTFSLVVTSQATGVATSLDYDLHIRQYVQEPIKAAAYAAMKDVAGEVKRRGRLEIAAGGFSQRWQNAYSVRLFPADRPSLNAAIHARHNIKYAGIFEAGGSVRGRPLMWLPLARNLPVLSGRISKMTPRRFVQQFGRLRSTRREDRRRGRPLLFGRRPGSKQWVPMFVGVDLLRQRSRFNTSRAVLQGARMFPEFYEQHIEAEAAKTPRRSIFGR